MTSNFRVGKGGGYKMNPQIGRCRVKFVGQGGSKMADKKVLKSSGFHV